MKKKKVVVLIFNCQFCRGNPNVFKDTRVRPVRSDALGMWSWGVDRFNGANCQL